ncbi:DNA cytosine methyltransferase [Halorussus gelatinilyticus]|uniref:DNA (cytosine-5-)-methyltransferase n=1 Tax=Halorussus gelatinilyticus TaxID=2937524 RepID=A0A8U0II64_9EURY|nr:DNA cytosine methyltransferase [Halorussus gelatinilyticus]UPV99963.1 DNA cytosine methyltransferase [Halorussus gelatinilyticus]
MKVAAVDLFCGAGGLSYGLQQAGVSVVAGIDQDPDCKYPYEQNIDAEYVRADVHALAQNPEPIAQMYPWDADLKVLAACAPCQPYSTMGHSKGDGHEDHQKWGLLNEVSRIVKYVEPDVVVTENVLQVKQEDGVYDAFVESLESQGYHVNSDDNKNVYCPEYGIPQKRKRWVVMASKQGPLSLPDPPIQNENDYPTVEDTIDHLPPIEAGEVSDVNDVHRARSLSEKNLERIDNMEPGGDWTLWEEPDLNHLLADCHRKASGQSYKAPYSRMRPDEPSPTITTQFYNYGSGRFGHYDTDQNRALSILEGALLQTFPEDYDFYDEWEDVGVSNLGRMIGNAVPPKLGEYMGKAILSHVGAAAPSVESTVADD